MLHHAYWSGLLKEEIEAAGLKLIVPAVPPILVSTWPSDFLILGFSFAISKME